MFKLRELAPCYQKPCIKVFTFLTMSINSLACNPMQTLPTHRGNLNLLKTISEVKNLKLGKAAHAQMIRCQQNDVIQTNHLINLYVKCGHLPVAHHVFDMMPEKNVV